MTRWIIVVCFAACTSEPRLATLGEALVTGPSNIANTPTASTLAFNFGNSLAVDGGGQLHAVWTEGSATSASVAYTRSSDNGATWSAPGLFGTGAIPAGFQSTLGPRVAASGSDIYIAWSGTYEGYPRIYLIHSANAGQTFTAPVAVSDPRIAASLPSLAASSALVAVAWSDQRSKLVGGVASTYAEVYARTSRDRGTTFAPTVAVSVPDRFSSWTPAIAVQGTELHVAWTDERFDTADCTDANTACQEEEFYRRSVDGGATWGPEVRLTHDAVGAPKSSWAPSIVVANATVHIAYFDFRTGPARIYYQRSTDGGATWAEQRISSASDLQPSARPVLSVIGGNVRMVFWRGPESGGPSDVYFAASSAAGAAGSWTTPVALTANIGHTTNSALQPQVVLSPNGSNHVIWMDDRTGHRQVFYARID